MQYTEQIQLDVSCNENAVEVTAKQQENNSRIIIASLYDSVSGSSLTIPDDTNICFRLRRPDGSLITADAENYSGKAKISLSQEMLFFAGRAAAEFRISTDEEVIAAANFVIDILPFPTGGKSSGIAYTNANILIVEKSEFDRIETKSTSTIYFVTDGENVKTYLGDTELSTGESSAPKTTTIYTAKPTTESYVTTVTKEEL